MKIHLKNGRVIDPSQQQDGLYDVFIAHNKIVSVSTQAPSDFVADITLDVQDCWVIPGCVDLCARLHQKTETTILHSELLAAVAGGVTSVVCPPDTLPILDELGLVERLKRCTHELQLAKVYPLGALTKQLQGQTLSEMHTLMQAGCIGLSQANAVVYDTRVLWRAMEYAATFGFTVFLHAEDPFLAEQGVAHEGEVAGKLGLNGIPNSAETLALQRLLHIAQKTNCRLHVTRISSAESVGLIAEAKQRGIAVTVDVCAHQLHLTDSDISGFNSYCHLKPPLRTKHDQLALRQGLADGTIDAICSDHTPVKQDDKRLPFAQSAIGAVGLELLLPLTLKWAQEDNISPSVALAKISCNSAQILQLPIPSLIAGAVADICVLDPHKQWVVDENQWLSCGKNSPFLGWTLQGKVRHTLVDGRICFSDGAV